jgi:hypothetical protein
VPRQDGFWRNYLGDFFECISSKPFTDLGQDNAVGVIEQQTTRDLVPENLIFSGQRLVAEQQFLIH